MNCYRCKIELTGKLTLADIIEKHEAYRRNFPNTYDQESPVMMCADCFDEIQEDTDDFERSEL